MTNLNFKIMVAILATNISLKSNAQNAEILFKEKYSKIELKFDVGVSFVTNNAYPFHQYQNSLVLSPGINYSFYQKNKINILTGLELRQMGIFEIEKYLDFYPLYTESWSLNFLEIPIAMQKFYKIENSKAYLYYTAGFHFIFDLDNSSISESSFTIGDVIYSSVVNEKAEKFNYGVNLGCGLLMDLKLMALKLELSVSHNFKPYMTFYENYQYEDRDFTSIQKLGYNNIQFKIGIIPKKLKINKPLPTLYTPNSG